MSKKRRQQAPPKAPKRIVANFPPVIPPPLTDLAINFRTGTKTVTLHIPHTELKKVAQLLYEGLKKAGITCSLEEKI